MRLADVACRNAGTVRAMAINVVGGLADKRHSADLTAFKVRMLGINAGVKDGDADALAGILRLEHVGGVDAPGGVLVVEVGGQRLLGRELGEGVYIAFAFVADNSGRFRFDGRRKKSLILEP